MSFKKSLVTPRVLIVGGGFAGTTLARKLILGMCGSTKLNVTLISNKSYFEYYPAFYRVVTGATPAEVCISLADLVPKEVDIVIDKIVSADLVKKEVKGLSGHVYTADYIVLATGSQTTYFNLPGLPDLSFGFKSIAEAVKLKKHIENLFIEKARSNNSLNSSTENPKDMVSAFQVVVVGGGPSGVEVSGNLVSYMKKLAINYRVDPSFVTVDLVERGGRLIPATHPHASAAALARLQNLGVNVFLNREVMSEDVEKILMSDMSLQTKTVIWTAGTSINALYNSIEGLQCTERHRVLVDDHLEAAGFKDIYIAGDGAGTTYAGLAQTAIHDGHYVANDILWKIDTTKIKKDRKIYKVKNIDYIIPIGHNWAIMSLGTFHIFGWPAYFVRQCLDFFYFAGILSIKKSFKLFWKGNKFQ